MSVLQRSTDLEAEAECGVDIRGTDTHGGWTQSSLLKAAAAATATLLTAELKPWKQSQYCFNLPIFDFEVHFGLVSTWFTLSASLF